MKWHRQTFLAQFPAEDLVSWEICEYHPTRIGYSGANNFEVSDLGRSIVLMTWEG